VIRLQHDHVRAVASDRIGVEFGEWFGPHAGGGAIEPASGDRGLDGAVQRDRDDRSIVGVRRKRRTRREPCLRHRAARTLDGTEPGRSQGDGNRFSFHGTSVAAPMRRGRTTLRECRAPGRGRGVQQPVRSFIQRAARPFNTRHVGGPTLAGQRALALPARYRGGGPAPGKGGPE
jgi:hypothetical protein